MEITERISDRGATDGELDALESQLGAKLPMDYRRFLQTFNGGRPRNRKFVAGDGEEGSSVHFFFTLAKNAPHYWIIREIESYSDRIPDLLLPIASDAFGNLVLLDLGARNHGAVYFWDHENENMNGRPYWDNIYKIAESFTEFVASLT